MPPTSPISRKRKIIKISLITYGILLIIISSLLEMILIPQRYMDIFEWNRKSSYGEPGGFPKDGEKISIYGELAKDWDTHQLFIYDENNNTTHIFLFPIGRDVDVGPGRFLVHGYPSPQSYSDGDAVLLTSCWNGTKSTLVWDIEHYDIAKDLIIFQGVGLLAGIILTIVGSLLFTTKKNRTEIQ